MNQNIRIKKLDQDVINRIAAGEVVTKPYASIEFSHKNLEK